MKKIKTLNKVIITISLSILMIIVFSIPIISNENIINKTKQTNAEVKKIEELNNKKIEWGIKRGTNNSQPDLGSYNKEIIEKYNGICLGNKDTKRIYLTFDMGYEAGYTEKILEVLKQNNVKATFFITGHYLNSKPELVKKMIDGGHIIGNHTVNHKSMPSCNLETIKKEVMDLHESLYKKYGYEMKYIRPPKGEYSERTVAYTNSLNYKTVMWSFAYDDWDKTKQGREEYGKNKVIENLHNGEVMLLHGTSKDNSVILDEIIKESKNKGYEFKSLDEFEE